MKERRRGGEEVKWRRRGEEGQRWRGGVKEEHEEKRERKTNPTLM